MEAYTYLLLNIFTLSGPLAFSFDKKVAFYKRWKQLFPALIITSALFITWDMVFTSLGVWSFNPAYLTGLTIGNLPIEEILFFFTVPYACVFLFDVLQAYVHRDFIGSWAPIITIVLFSILVIMAITHLSLWYTSITFLLTAALLIYLQFFRREVMGWYYIAYLLHLVPFLAVNGILTSLPVVEYNDLYNLGYRLYTIPIEDTVYSMLLLFLTLAIYRRKSIA